MRLEREPIFNRPILMLSVACLIFISSYSVMAFVSTEELETNWTLTYAGAGESIPTGQATDFHIFLEDELGSSVDQATVTAVFDRPGTVHHIEKGFSRLEGGLYEAEVVFSIPGTWIAMIEARKGNQLYRNQIIFTVEGFVVSETNWDPNDHFHFDQPLPMDIERQIMNVSK
ncbi:FixH family protein [Alkalihalobacillus sp. MEB130]|uniref:FixH family protein n=1 Tax=Alkalihalobacillus sp. MEB130 TaxID=2976704 RepID=UPI0028DED8D3|nr:FixH family protein [Alkalihalobacillus sp. MEB130]MDT8862064.1 FixH family protein [Alkalihalobacillus sp. MEB130]